MLAGDFFYIKEMTSEDGKIDALLEINATHTVFDGHFPGQPVVPGVCMMQMVKEVLEAALSRDTIIDTADHLKFLTVINPTENNLIHAEIKYTVEAAGNISLSATLLNGQVIYFKMRAVLK